MYRPNADDIRAVHMVILFLGLFCLVGLLGLLLLVWHGRSLPEGLLAIVGTAVGGLGAILARTQTAAPGPPEPVSARIENPPTDPVLTRDISASGGQEETREARARTGQAKTGAGR